MKKTNFIVVFWLLLALISFAVVLFNFSSILNSLSFLILPVEDEYRDKHDAYRQLITSVPMLLLCSVSFYFGLRQGLRHYKEL